MLIAGPCSKLTLDKVGGSGEGAIRVYANGRREKVR
jgi:hypothetical protein